MRIAICGSIDFTYEMKEAADKLGKMSHETVLPLTSERILSGKLTLENFKKSSNDDGSFRKIKDDVIKRYFNIIKETDAVLVMNLDKKGINNYIGGNTLLEMGFAHVLDKKIYLLNQIPEMSYTDELRAMRPVILDSDFSQIKD